MNYCYENRVEYWRKGLNIFYDIDGTLVSLIDRKLRPNIPFLFKQQTQRYGHKIFVWSSAGKEYCLKTVADLGLSSYVADCFEKPPYDRPGHLGYVGCHEIPHLCYDDDPSDVISLFGGLVVKPYLGDDNDEEWIAMNHFLGVFARRFSSDLMLMKTKDGRVDKSSLTWLPECRTTLN